MHELSLIKDLVRKITSVACEHRDGKIVSVTVRLGALSHISPDHFREHFNHGTQGTPAEGAQLHIKIMTDMNDPFAQEVLLESVEIGD